MCGEQHLITSLYSLYLGSPPRVRGTVASAGSGSSNLRITPACAGNRTAFPPQSGQVKDHPRVCGEQFNLPQQQTAIVGSPPRVRGTD